MLRKCMLVTLGFLLLNTGAPAEEPQGKGEKKNRFEDIHADQMELKMSAEEGAGSDVALKGKVKIIATQFRLKADYAEGQQNPDGEFVMGHALGNVRIFTPDTMLHGDRLDYDAKTGKAILTSENDRPRAWKAGKIIRATRIIYDLKAAETGGDRERVLFEGNASVSDGPMPAEHAEEFPKLAKETN